MMRNAILLLFLSLTFSNCTFLQVESYLEVTAPNVAKQSSECGYFDPNLITVRKNNQALLKSDGYDISICSKPFHSKDIATGFIIPIIPFKRDWGEDDRYVKVSNNGTESIFLDSINSENVKSGFQVELSLGKYPKVFAKSDTWDVNQESYTIESKKSVWLKLPASDITVLILRTSSGMIPVKFTINKGYSVWMITV